MFTFATCSNHVLWQFLFFLFCIFLILFVTFKYILFIYRLCFNLLIKSVTLPSKRGYQNILQVISLIASLKCQLQDYRENRWHNVLNQVNNFCQLHSIPILDMNETMLVDSHGRRRIKRELITNLHYYRVQIFLSGIIKKKNFVC